MKGNTFSHSILSADLISSYLSELQEALESCGEEGFLRFREIQAVVQTVNKGGDEQERRLRAVRAVNAALSGAGGAEETAAALADPALALGQIYFEAAHLYHSELRYVRDESGAGELDAAIVLSRCGTYYPTPLQICDTKAFTPSRSS